MKILFYPPNKPALVARVRTSLSELSVAIADTEDELEAAIGTADILVTGNRPYTETAARIIRDHGRCLKMIHFTTSGIDTALKNGLPDNVVVTNSAGTHANRIAQHAFALMLALTRCLNDAVDARKRHDWAHDELGGKMTSLENATLVLLGLGAVGQAIARKANAFDMHVIGVSRSTQPLPHVDEIRPRDRLLETLAEADVVAFATTYDETTHHMLDKQGLAALKPSAIIVNVARGPLIDEAALIDALRAGRIGGVGIDVMTIEPLPTDSPLWDLPNVIMTPHNASAGGDGQVEGIFNIIQQNLARMNTGQTPINRVYGPDKVPQTA